MIRIQEEDFDYASEVAAMSEGNLGVGGVVAFSGLVREMAGDTEINSMTLEHYPGMTEKALEKIEAEAQKRWPLENTLIIHRYGRLEPGDQIVFVAASSAHRDAAFDACRLFDRLAKDQSAILETGRNRPGRRMGRCQRHR